MAYLDVHRELETKTRFTATAITKGVGIFFLSLGIVMHFMAGYMFFAKLVPLEEQKAVMLTEAGNSDTATVLIIQQQKELVESKIYMLLFLGLGNMLVAGNLGIIVLARALWYRLPDHLYYLLVKKPGDQSK